MKKEIYWKAVTDDFPGGVICETKEDAQYWTEEDRACGIKGSTCISKCCNGKQKTHKGSVWKFK